MNERLNKIKLACLLALIFSSFTFEISAQRDRIIIKPTPTPNASPTPNVSPTSIPTPTTNANPTPTPVSVQTLPSLQSKIRFAMQRPELRRGSIGIKIVSLDTGKTIYDENSEKYFMPASNMKVFTVAAALEKLSPNFKFVTTVYAPVMPDENGTIKGNLMIYGRGDISFSEGFSEGDYYKHFDDLATKIAQAGVKKIEGNLIGDESYFRGSAIPSGWEWDDLQWYYGAEISALSVNDNAVDLSVKSGANESPCAAQILPFNTLYKIINRCATAEGKRTLRVTKRLDQNIVELDGTMPPNDSFSGSITFSHPADLFMQILRQRLEQKGITITGGTAASNNVIYSLPSKLELTKLESTPLGIIAQKTLKPSQNLYTETMLWTLGEQLGDKADTSSSSSDKGLAVVQKFLQEIGVAPDSVIQSDGSGLSRHNLVTPNAVVQVFTYMAKSRHSIAWNAALTVAGVDGTLKNRFRGTSAAINVRGKTGTIDQVSSLSGYANSASGEKFVFSIIVNGVNQSSVRVQTIDDIVVALSDFDGRTDF